jgi:hypothetical protein
MSPEITGRRPETSPKLETAPKTQMTNFPVHYPLLKHEPERNANILLSEIITPSQHLLSETLSMRDLGIAEVCQLLKHGVSFSEVRRYLSERPSAIRQIEVLIPYLDIQGLDELIDLSLRHSRADKIAEHAQDFFRAGYPAEQLVDRLLAENKSEAILKWLNQFPPTAIDISRIVDIQFAEDRLNIFSYIPIILAAGYPPETFSQRLLEAISWDGLLYFMRHLSLFPHGTVDVNKLLRLLLSHNLIDALADNFNALLEAGVDTRELANTLLAIPRKAAVVARHIENFITAEYTASDLTADFSVFGYDEYILGYAEKLRATPANPQVMCDTLSAHQLSHICDRMEQLSRLGVNTTAIAKKLIAGNQSREVAAHFKHFLASDPSCGQELIELLMQTQRADYIVEHLDQFPAHSVDGKQLLDQCYASKEFQLIYKNADQLLAHGADPKTLVLALKAGNKFDALSLFIPKLFEAGLDVDWLLDNTLPSDRDLSVLSRLSELLLEYGCSTKKFIELYKRHGKFELIAEHAKTFIARGCDPKEIVDLVLDANRPDVLVKLLDIVPEGLINIQDLVDYRLLRFDDEFIERFRIIRENIPLLLDKGYSAQKLAHLLVSRKFTTLVLAHFEAFKQHGLNVDLFTQYLVAENQYQALAILVQDQRLDVAELPPSLLTKYELFDGKITNHLSMERYFFLLQLVRQVPKLAADLAQSLDRESIQRQYQALLKDGRQQTAQDLWDLATYLGFTLDRPLQLTVPDKSHAQTDVAEFVGHLTPETRINASLECAQFYTCEWALIACEKLAVVPDYANRADYSTLATYHALRRETRAQEVALTTWLKWYVLTAVTGELRQHPETRQHLLIVNDPETMCKTWSVEQILDFLSNASRTFAYAFSDYATVGGSKWSAIAEAAYALWNSSTVSRELIDHVFDLEHNNGQIFDKSKLVKNDEDVMTIILEAKYTAQSPIAMLDALPPAVMSSSMIETLLAAQKLLDTAEQFKRK